MVATTILGLSIIRLARSVAACRFGAELRDQLVGVVAGALGADRRLGLQPVVLAHRDTDLKALATCLTLEFVACHRARPPAGEIYSTRPSSTDRRPSVPLSARSTSRWIDTAYSLFGCHGSRSHVA